MDLDNELHRLAEGIAPPGTAPEDDLQRGRDRLARRRAGLGGAAIASLAVAAVIGGVALAGGGSGGQPGGQRGDEPGFAGSPRASSELSGSAALEQVRDRHDGPATVEEALQTWLDVLAEHLDPSGEHLQKVPDNEQGGGDGEGHRYLGTKLGWSVPGEQGLGMVQIGVADDRAALDGWWMCGEPQEPGWSCTTVGVGSATAERAFVGENDDLAQVLVQANGNWVLISLDPLFGNNSTVGLDEFGFEPSLLIEAAADPRLQLPPG